MCRAPLLSPRSLLLLLESHTHTSPGNARLLDKVSRFTKLTRLQLNLGPSECQLASPLSVSSGGAWNTEREDTVDRLMALLAGWLTRSNGARWMINVPFTLQICCQQEWWPPPNPGHTNKPTFVGSKILHLFHLAIISCVLPVSGFLCQPEQRQSFWQ